MTKKNCKNQLKLLNQFQQSHTGLLFCLLIVLILEPNNAFAENIESISGPSMSIDKVTKEDQESRVNDVILDPAKPKTTNSILSANEQNKALTKIKHNPWAFLHPFKANYTVYSDNKKLGSATRELSNEEGNWKIRRTGKLSKWLLSLKSDEYSSFKILEHKLMVESFMTSSKVSFKDKKTINQHFDWQNKVETGNKGKRNWELALNQDTYDRMSHIVQMQADLLTNKESFSYLISYKGKRELYTYHIASVEKIETPFGILDAIKMERDDGNESNSIWFSPELNYFPVKISKFEQDEAEIVLILNNLIYSDSDMPI